MNVMVDDELAALPPHGWLVITCKGGMEERARSELQKQKYRPFLPWALVRRERRGKPYITREPLFPCYLFVAMLAGVRLEEMRLNAIKNTKGVIGLVSTANRGLPNVVGHPFVAALQRRIDADGGSLIIERDWESGEVVRIERGPFAGYSGTVSHLQMACASQRVTLLLDMLGSQVAMSISTGDVARSGTTWACGSVSGAQPIPLRR